MQALHGCQEGKDDEDIVARFRHHGPGPDWRVEHACLQSGEMVDQNYTASPMKTRWRGAGLRGLIRLVILYPPRSWSGSRMDRVTDSGTLCTS